MGRKREASTLVRSRLPGELGKSPGGEQVHRPEVHEAAAWPGTGHLGDHLLAKKSVVHPVRHQPLLLGQPACNRACSGT